MICNICQQNLPDKKFKIKYYRNDWTPYRRKTCKSCKWENDPDKILKRNLARSKRYSKNKKIKKDISYALDKNKEKIKLITQSTWMNFLDRCYRRLSLVRKKYWSENIVVKKIRPEYIFEAFRIQNNLCKYCEKQLNINDPSSYEVDHTIPFSCWWWHEEENIQFLCPDCHRIKSWYESNWRTAKIKKV